MLSMIAKLCSSTNKLRNDLMCAKASEEVVSRWIVFLSATSSKLKYLIVTDHAWYSFFWIHFGQVSPISKSIMAFPLCKSFPGSLQRKFHPPCVGWPVLVHQVDNQVRHVHRIVQRRIDEMGRFHEIVNRYLHRLSEVRKILAHVEVGVK